MVVTTQDRWVSLFLKILCSVLCYCCSDAAKAGRTTGRTREDSRGGRAGVVVCSSLGSKLISVCVTGLCVHNQLTGFKLSVMSGQGVTCLRVLVASRSHGLSLLCVDLDHASTKVRLTHVSYLYLLAIVQQIPLHTACVCICACTAYFCMCAGM